MRDVSVCRRTDSGPEYGTPESGDGLHFACCSTRSVRRARAGGPARALGYGTAGYFRPELYRKCSERAQWRWLQW